jgi:peptidoglycan/LPS O-acetylase OafA/YrhL
VHGFVHSSAEPLWSVSIEEQFYLFWPLLLVLACRKRLVVFLALGLFALSNVLRLTAHPSSFCQIWCNTLTRLDAIALGAIWAALVHATGYQLSAKLRFSALAAGILMIPGYFFVAGLQRFFAGRDMVIYPLSALACLLVLIAVYSPSRRDGIGESTFIRFWAWLGRISYGLYVFHVIAISLIAEYLGPWLQPNAGGYLVQFVCGLALTTLLAWGSYVFWESPFLRLKERFTYIVSSPVKTNRRNLPAADRPAVGESQAF